MQKTCIDFAASTPQKSEANEFIEVFAYDGSTDIVLTHRVC